MTDATPPRVQAAQGAQGQPLAKAQRAATPPGGLPKARLRQGEHIEFQAFGPFGLALAVDGEFSSCRVMVELIFGEDTRVPMEQLTKAGYYDFNLHLPHKVRVTYTAGKAPTVFLALDQSPRPAAGA